MDNRNVLTGTFSKLSGFFSWWRAELMGLMPENIQRMAAESEPSVALGLRQGHIDTIFIPGQELAGISDTQGISSYLESIDQLLMPVVVSLPVEELLCRRIQLPIAVMENLSEVIRFEMDRQTPFHVDDVYYAYRINGKSADKQHISLDLCVVPREKVLSAMSPLQHIQLDYDAASLSGEKLKVRFISADYREQSSPVKQYTGLVASMILLIAVIMTPFWLQGMSLQGLQAELETVRQYTREAQEINQRLRQHVGVLDVLQQHKRGLPPTIEVLDQLSQLIPDDTWLTRLEIKQGKVHIEGFSLSSSSLIAILEASSHFSNARFDSPVTLDKDSQQEKFRIVVEMREVSS